MGCLGQPDDGIGTVSFSIVVNGAILLILLAVFEVLLHWPRARLFVAPRMALGVTARAAAAGLPAGPLGWLRRVRRDSADLWSLQPDGIVIVRFLELGFKFSVCGSLLDFLLVPVYAWGDGGKTGLNRYSLMNLNRRSPHFWGVIVAAYVLTAIFLFFISCEWDHFVLLRREHFRRSARGVCGPVAAQVQRSIMVELLPPDAQSAKGVAHYFEQLFGPGSVYACIVQGETRAKYRFQEQHIPKWTPRTSFCHRYHPPQCRFQDRAQPRRQSTSRWQRAAAAISVAREFGRQAKGAARALQDVTIGRAGTCTAFVTLRSAARWAEVQQVVLSHSEFWHIRPAPHPGDLLWRNVATPPAQAKLRNKLANASCVLGLLFWSVPVSFIQAWANIDNLRRWSPDVDIKAKSPAVHSFLSSYLPVLALIGLQCLLPFVFQAEAARYERNKTKSSVQRIVLIRCFSYQLASLYVTVLSGSLWGSLQRILAKPADILPILSNSLPKAAVYFITYVIARVAMLPVLLLRPLDFFAGWPAPLARPLIPRCAYGCEAASAALVLVIGLTYSFIAPAILPVCALYFGLAALVYRWLFTHVYEPEFDGAGVFWFDLFDCVLLGLFLGTLSLVALLAVYADRLQFLAAVPLPSCIGLFAFYTWRTVRQASKWVALEDANEMDQDPDVDQSSQFSPNLYFDPALISLKYTCVPATLGGGADDQVSATEMVALR